MSWKNATRPEPGPARGVLRHAPPPPDRITHGRHAPSPALAEVIEHYWLVSWDLRGLPPFAPETLPHPSVHIVAQDGEALAHGIHRGRFTTTLADAGRVIGVKFRPAMFQSLLGRPVSSIANRSVALDTLFGADGHTLARTMLSDDPADSVLESIDAFLRERVPPPDATAVTVRGIVADIMRDRTLTRADDVAARHGLTLRTLQRLFGRYVGATPKWVIQRYRLHEAAEQLAADPDASYSALALALGYGDQAHFINDFRRLIGVAPAAYHRRVHGS